MRTFRSDNNAGLCPEAMQALIDANDGSHEVGYGDDTFTERAVATFRELLGPETAVCFVATGSAANVLAIASLTETWQRVVCHHHSHWNADESTAPERFTTCRTTAIHTDEPKLTLDDLRAALFTGRADVHEPQPGVVTISNTTEFATAYTPAEVRAICDIAHEAGYRVHMDGARFANAVAALNCDPRELTIDAGVDALSFGGTKNGLAFGEAICLFPQGDGRAYERAVATIEYHRKGSGHLLSKHRFVSAPFEATLRDGIWLRHAAHANAMAARLAEGLRELDLEPRFPVEANGVFISLPDPVDEALRAAGHGYYPFGEAAWKLSRLMCSFDTTPEDVDGLLADARSAVIR
jgi:threonine aldolase